MRVLLLNGPNLDLLGTRRPDVYGTTTLADLEQAFSAWAENLGVDAETFQSNHEGALIDRIHDARSDVDAIVFNPGAYTHTSYALRDAIEAVEIPTIEVHISDVTAREPWRAVSVIEDVCVHRIFGRGVEGYRWALVHLATRHRHPAERIHYGDDPQQFIDLRRGSGERLAVLVHGGFWRARWTLETLDLLAVDLQSRGWSTANVEYRRMGTGGGWPVTADDVLAAIHAAVDATSPSAVALVGHSAGGQLALEAGAGLAHLAPTVVSMGGVNDMVLAVETRVGDGAAVDYLGDHDPSPASPAHRTPTGRVVIAHGTEDSEVPFAFAEAYLRRHPEAELIATDGGDHGRFLDPSDEMWSTVVDALDQR